MSSRVITLSRPSAETLDDIADWLIKQFANTIVEPELVFSQKNILGNADILLMIFERYYMRNGSYANLTVQLTDDGTVQNAVLVGSGGGEGILNFSWGANSNFAEKAADILKQKEFH